MSRTLIQRRLRKALLVLAVTLSVHAELWVIGSGAAVAQVSVNREAAGGRTAHPPIERRALAAQLDSIVRAELAQAPLVGVSVAVLQRRDTVFQRGYGYADLGLQAPATEATTYRVIGPMLGVALMQQVEHGRLRLDDDAALLIPSFHGRAGE